MRFGSDFPDINSGIPEDWTPVDPSTVMIEPSAVSTGTSWYDVVAKYGIAIAQSIWGNNNPSSYPYYRQASYYGGANNKILGMDQNTFLLMAVGLAAIVILKRR